MTLRIGTRGSALALAQAGWVAERLPVAAELVTITTSGDLGRGPADKSRWVDAFVRALLAGKVDLALHSGGEDNVTVTLAQYQMPRESSR